MISVCMASFNGSDFIGAQIKSILSQLSNSDELIIVDDASEDDTIAVINSFNDERIRLIENFSNRGVVYSFEKALRLACGDIIVLSDQDDLWYCDKVSNIQAVFDKYPSVTLCVSDADLINERGELFNKTYYEVRGEFRPGVLNNIIKNKFLGCALAFRIKLCRNILPIPHNVPAHDMWIGIINEIHGKTFYIEKPLFQYRRHGRNVSPMSHQSLIRMLKWRASLIYNLSKYALKNLTGV